MRLMVDLCFGHFVSLLVSGVCMLFVSNFCGFFASLLLDHVLATRKVLALPPRLISVGW